MKLTGEAVNSPHVTKRECIVSETMTSRVLGQSLPSVGDNLMRPAERSLTAIPTPHALLPTTPLLMNYTFQCNTTLQLQSDTMLLSTQFNRPQCCQVHTSIGHSAIKYTLQSVTVLSSTHLNRPQCYQVHTSICHSAVKYTVQ